MPGKAPGEEAAKPGGLGKFLTGHPRSLGLRMKDNTGREEGRGTFYMLGLGGLADRSDLKVLHARAKDTYLSSASSVQNFTVSAIGRSKCSPRP